MSLKKMTPDQKTLADKKLTRNTLAKEIIAQSIYMKEKGLTPGHTGNISARYKDGFLITPTGVPYNQLKPDQIVHIVSLVNNCQEQKLWDQSGFRPSSEWQFHRAAYQANKSIKALVHTHSNYATILACAGKEIPPFHYMIAAAGADVIPLVPYAIFGSKQLSDGVKISMTGGKACLLAHHGQLAGEGTLAKAMELAEIIEDLAHQYWALLQLGDVKLLSKSEMKAVHQKFKTYGQQNI